MKCRDGEIYGEAEFLRWAMSREAVSLMWLPMTSDVFIFPHFRPKLLMHKVEMAQADYDGERYSQVLPF